MSRVLCAGCDLFFSFSGYSAHLSTTRKPLCAALFRSQQEYVPHAEPTPSVQSPPTSPRHFEGDAFGADYGPDDFPFPHTDEYKLLSDILLVPQGDDNPDKANSDMDSDAEEDADNFRILQEPHWEPPPSSLPAVSPTLPLPTSSTSTPDEDLSMHFGRLLNERERQDAEGSIWTRPVIRRFPGNNAGAPLSQVKQARAGYREIQSEIDADDGHIWAPFRSKLDWEFARWAKLRGPTSTAVSELLAIDEVSPSHEVSLLVNTYLCIIGPRSARLVL